MTLPSPTPRPLVTPAPRVPDRDLVVCAPASLRIAEIARRVAATDCTVLIAGESGTGKEVLAQYVHRHSARRDGPFVAVNCAAIPDNMLEAMLFGWERGAFTGAQAAHAGKFEQAQSGTLLLDEISEMPLVLQAKLLRVLQEKEVERLGGRGAIALDVRVIATTNRRLREEVAAGRFREDLYYRLNVFPLALGPLRERREDILPLAMQLVASHCRPGVRVPALAAPAAQLLLTYDWPGNVRELDNLVQRALVLCGGDIVGAEHILFEPEVPFETRQAPFACAAATVPQAATPRAADLAGGLALAERDLILGALRDAGSKGRAAERLGISARTLRYKLARLRELGLAIDCREPVAT
ncbi:MAG TPA: sigma-54 dependent transcriptional regulator [Steroidobacteraceae bacterium]|nr:sigma-54 dependent transcriptional regulator [Steroidobacteraceae bacterium]